MKKKKVGSGINDLIVGEAKEERGNQWWLVARKQHIKCGKWKVEVRLKGTMERRVTKAMLIAGKLKLPITINGQCQYEVRVMLGNISKGNHKGDSSN